MYFDGGVRDVVLPQNTTGPWHLTRPEMAGQPTIPCQACHAIHSNGAPETRAERISVAGTPVQDSLALFDRREQQHFRAALLAVPAVYDRERPLKVSPIRGRVFAINATRPGSQRPAPWRRRTAGERRPAPAMTARP
jgi:hypothetical protein